MKRPLLSLNCTLMGSIGGEIVVALCVIYVKTHGKRSIRDTVKVPITLIHIVVCWLRNGTYNTPAGAWPRCSEVDVIDWRIAWVSRIGMSGKVERRFGHCKPIIRTNPYTSRKRDDFECCGNKV